MAWTDGSFPVSLLPSSIQQETLSNSWCPPFCACFLTHRHNWSCSCLPVGLFSFLFHSTPEWSCKKIHQNLRSLKILWPSGVCIQSQTPHKAHKPWLIGFFPNSSSHSPPTPLINWRSSNTPDLVLPVNINCNALPISCPIPSQASGVHFSAERSSPIQVLSPRLTFISNPVPVSTCSFSCPSVCLKSIFCLLCSSVCLLPREAVDTQWLLGKCVANRRQ